MKTNYFFIRSLESQLKNKLPGFSAQSKMAPVPRSLPVNIMTEKPPIHSAVLILFFPENGSWSFFLTERSYQVENHKGQVSLPGGAREHNESLRQTALRETREELGIDVSNISIIGELTPLLIPVSGFKVHPYVGWMDKKPGINPNPVEVAKIYDISLEALLLKRNIKRENRTIHETKIDVPFFDFDGVEVWGATAMILSEIREIVFSIGESLDGIHPTGKAQVTKTYECLDGRMHG